MISQYTQFILYTSIISILANFLRFKCRGNLNKWILIASSLVLVKVEDLLFDSVHMNWMLLIFIGMSVICFHAYGGIASVLISWCIIFAQTGESNMFVLCIYSLVAAGVYVLTEYIRKVKIESDDWLSKLSLNSKQLNVFKEVSFSIQQTLNLQKLLHTILTSVTAGHGLGFNRAMILLVDEDGIKLNGIMGTGPMTVTEGYAVWDRITKSKYKLMDLIEGKETEKSVDLLLNEQVKRLEIPLDEPNFLYQALESGEPLHITRIDESDNTLWLFADQFNMSELVVFPLISQGAKVGVLIIDNPVNKKPITPSDVDSVTHLANQASIAIQHIHLYGKIEDLAIKDGLTGLFNQRSLQTYLEQHLGELQGTLSIILLDIDHFKHFNDTNGHLLGNQVLIQLAEVIRNSIMEDHVAFRFGGEEFIIVLPHTNKEIACFVAERIRSNVENAPFPCRDGQPSGRLTISLGVASSEELGALTSIELVDVADQAMYKAKKAGRNRVVSS